MCLANGRKGQNADAEELVNEAVCLIGAGQLDLAKEKLKEAIDAAIEEYGVPDPDDFVQHRDADEFIQQNDLVDSDELEKQLENVDWDDKIQNWVSNSDLVCDTELEQAVDGLASAERVTALEAVMSRGLLGRLKWLITGR